MQTSFNHKLPEVKTLATPLSPRHTVCRHTMSYTQKRKTARRYAKKQLPMREGPDDESFFTIWVEISDMRTQEEITIEAFRTTIDAVKKVD